LMVAIQHAPTAEELEAGDEAAMEELGIEQDATDEELAEQAAAAESGEGEDSTDTEKSDES
ncbi:MAG: 50S ribosomal protein L25, partial [Actinomycetota bacterium]|nr:50S ribosomal protein L25 [Actinomycetota bacterium]